MHLPSLHSLLYSSLPSLLLLLPYAFLPMLTFLFMYSEETIFSISSKDPSFKVLRLSTCFFFPWCVLTWFSWREERKTEERERFVGKAASMFTSFLAFICHPSFLFSLSRSSHDSRAASGMIDRKKYLLGHRCYKWPLVCMYVFYCVSACMFLHTDCALAAGPLQIKRGLLGAHL